MMARLCFLVIAQKNKDMVDILTFVVIAVIVDVVRKFIVYKDYQKSDIICTVIFVLFAYSINCLFSNQDCKQDIGVIIFFTSVLLNCGIGCEIVYKFENNKYENKMKKVFEVYSKNLIFIFCFILYFVLVYII